MRLKPFLLAGLCTMSASVAAATLSPRDFAYHAPLKLEGEAPFYDVALPAAVYRGMARPDLADLRVFNGDGALVPTASVPRPSPARAARPPLELTLFPLKSTLPSIDASTLSLSVQRSAAGAFSLNLGTPLPGTGATIGADAAAPAERIVGYIVDLGEKPEPLSAVTLRWDALPRSIGTRVRIDASEDLATWRVLVADAPLVDVAFEGKRLRRDRVDLPVAQERYLRITWPSESALAFTGAAGEHADQPVAPALQWIDAAAAVAGDHEGDLDYDLGGVFPVESLVLAPAETNTVAPVRIYARTAAKDSWQHAAAGIVYRLRQGGADVDSPPIALGTAPVRYLRVHVDATSAGWGATAPTLRAGWMPQHLVFAARGSGPFTLDYGDADAGPASLQIQALVPGYGGTSPAAIGSATVDIAAISGAAPAPRAFAGIDVRRWVLWAVLLLGVAALAAMAWHLSREMQAAGARASPATQPPRESR